MDRVKYPGSFFRQQRDIGYVYNTPLPLAMNAALKPALPSPSRSLPNPKAKH